jgi:hypothetical protein
MNTLQEKVLSAFFASHHGVITRAEALSLGITEEQLKWHLRTGRWAKMYRGLYRRAGETAGPEARLYAACLAAGRGAVASHASAAWLWELITEAPARPAVTVGRERSDHPAGIEHHRRSDIDPSRILVRRGIAVTDPLRTLADLGEVVDAAALDDAVDRALARRLVTVDGLDREVARLQRPGRRGVGRLRAALDRRGLNGAPHPSVLESRTLRLLHRWRIRPTGAEVVVHEGRYRLDVLLRPGLALEVDGYSFHWSPEAKAADSRRRNELRLAGIVVVEADWITVMREPHRFRASLQAAFNLVAEGDVGVRAGSPPIVSNGSSTRAGGQAGRPGTGRARTGVMSRQHNR